MTSIDRLPVDILVAVLKDHYEDQCGLWTLSAVSRLFREAVRIVRRSPDGRKTTEYKGKRAWDKSCEWGSLVSVKWLHDHRLEGCTKDAMDYAASNGHLEVVKFLHANRIEGCTTDAMDHSASNGHLEVVKFLHANRHKGCTTDAIAMDCAARYGHLEVVEWLRGLANT